MQLRSFSRALAYMALIAACACAPTPQRDSARLARDAIDRGRMISAPPPPRVIAAARSDIPAAAAAAGAVSVGDLSARRGTRAIEVAEIPFLRATPDGAVFLAGAQHRALARGEPRHACPATGAALGAANAAGAATQALSNCFAALERRGASTECGCRVIALDAVLLDGREAFVHAPGVSAHLTGVAPRPLNLIAEALPPNGAVAQVLLRNAAGPFGALRMIGESAEMQLAATPDTVWTGSREMFGYRRGRIAERIVFGATDGRQATLLIGVERRDVESQ